MVKKFLQYILCYLSVRLSLIFKKKEDIFNSFLAKQSALVSNNSALPNKITYMMEEKIHSVTFSESDVIKIIKVMNINKVHDHDNISFRMIKLCTYSSFTYFDISKL